jgi:hypothetical protein
MASCARCNEPLPPARGNRPRKWCDDACRRLGPLPSSSDGVATLDEVLRLLSARARHGSVAAMTALLRYFERSRSLAQDGEADDRLRTSTRSRQTDMPEPLPSRPMRAKRSRGPVLAGRTRRTARGS